MAGWTKLFSSIVTSSIWCEDHKTVWVWTGFLALADKDGVVEGSIPGLANVMRVTDDELAEGRNSYALQFESNLASDRFVQGQLLRGIENGRDFAYLAQEQDQVQRLRREDIARALQRHLAHAPLVSMKAGDLQGAAPAPAAATPPAGSAGSEAPALPERMARFDRNGDGKLQKSEAPERMQEIFERIDTNGDGAVDGAEAAAMRERREQRRRPPS